MEEELKREELKRVECLIERCSQCKLNACITCDICWSEVQAIENLVKQYKELKKHISFYEKNESYKAKIIELEKENSRLYERAVIAEDNLKQVKNELRDYVYNSIPTSVIQEKVEELEEQRDNIKIFKNIDEYDRCIGKIEVLQEILEEGRK